MARLDPHSVTDPSQGRLRHLTLQLQVDFPRRQLRCRARYEVDGRRPGPLDLDTHGLDILDVHGPRGPIDYDLGPLDPIFGRRLRLSDLPDAPFEIEFATTPASRALQWLTPAQTADGLHPFLFTQCQPIHARSVFPCQDSPSIRFTYEAEVRVPTPLTAVMAAAPLAREDHDGARTYRFRMDQPIPSYLFALAVGDLVEREIGPRSRVVAEPPIVDAAAREFDRTEAMLAEAEKLYGPYVWERYDMLVMPPSFPYGGMENPRLTFLTPTMIVGDRSLTNLIAHELAHSWTGNLVTNATWEDFWLNEGWTTYAERRILEAIEGEESAMLHAAVGRNTMLRDLDRFGWEANPTRLKFSQVGVDPDTVTSYIAYEKGYAFLVRLERIVGRPAFDAFTRKYIAERRFQSMTTEAFIEVLRRDLPRVFDEVDVRAWLYAPGFPADAPTFESRLADEVSRRLFDYQEGRLPRREDFAGWSPIQAQLFLQYFPRMVPLSHCRAIEAALGLDRTRVPHLLSHFLEVAVRSGYREALARAEDLVTTVGRIVIIRPVFLALVETEWSRPRARPLFDRVRDRHHPITVLLLEQVLKDHGL